LRIQRDQLDLYARRDRLRVERNEFNRRVGWKRLGVQGHQLDLDARGIG